jgi:hypothetical protein
MGMPTQLASDKQSIYVHSGQSEGYGGGDSWGAQTPRTQLTGSAMERNVARLFRDRVKFSAAVEFTQASILAGQLQLSGYLWMLILPYQSLF